MDEQQQTIEAAAQVVAELVGDRPTIGGTVLALVAAVQRLAEENTRLAEENVRLAEEVAHLSGGRLVDSEPVYDAGDPPPESIVPLDAAAVLEDNIPDAVYVRQLHESARLTSGDHDGTAADYWPEGGVSW